MSQPVFTAMGAISAPVLRDEPVSQASERHRLASFFRLQFGERFKQWRLSVDWHGRSDAIEHA
jgi:hypothetical protein